MWFRGGRSSLPGSQEQQQSNRPTALPEEIVDNSDLESSFRTSKVSFAEGTNIDDIENGRAALNSNKTKATEKSPAKKLDGHTKGKSAVQALNNSEAEAIPDQITITTVDDLPITISNVEEGPTNPVLKGVQPLAPKVVACSSTRAALVWAKRCYQYDDSKPEEEATIDVSDEPRKGRIEGLQYWKVRWRESGPTKGPWTYRKVFPAPKEGKRVGAVIINLAPSTTYEITLMAVTEAHPGGSYPSEAKLFTTQPEDQPQDLTFPVIKANL